MSYQFNFSAVLGYWPLVWTGVLVTLRLAFFSTIFGFTLGTLCALGRTSGSASLQRVIAVYVEVIRNTPLIIQAYFLIFGLSSVGVRWPIEVGATLALVINIGAYTTEIMRAGIESVRKTQLEAAECLGLNRWQTFIHIVLRPAMERVYPALTGQYVLLMLVTSILSSVGVEELFGIANRIQTETYRNFEVFIVLGFAYLVLSLFVRFVFYLLGLVLFPRRRKLGTAL
ncbi:amino acid ABC transporter permease [Devosia salina]|uniref:Amino acid ABC transporter permease n=1 Tax=Devosia salina TaxID=2860336 RepID=A0ABX8WDG7_9HYPH|nr:amino acid ABC transporter permease [Devosia salina]QYO75639.1 amino acid ABC transporter permease [Devosia salina]